MPRTLTALARVSVTLSTIVVGLVLLLPSAGSAADEWPDTEVYVVQPGDTLWEIASEVDAKGDVRDLVGAIRSLNDLETSTIVPGQRLEIPASP